MRSISVPRAVSITIGTSDRRRSSRQTSRPSPSGRLRSSITRSGSISSASSIAPAAVPVTIASKPARRNASAKGWEIESSSSTTRIRPAGAAFIAIGPL